MINRRKLLTTIVCISLYLSFYTPVQAQTVSLSIWPPILDVIIQPGKAITQVFRLTNNGDNTTITASIVPFEPADNFGHVKLSSTPSPATAYFSLQNADLNLPAAFALKAGESQELVLKIRVPDTAPEADHYLTFLFDSSNLGLIAGTGTKTQGSIGANVLLTVSKTGQPVRLAKIDSFTLSPCLFNLSYCLLDSFDQPQFKFLVKNTGRNRFKAVGQIDIRNTFNKKIATLGFRQDNVLANSFRYLTSDTTWNPVFPVGRYQATAAITPEDSVNTVSQTLTFLILPYKALLILGLLILFFSLLRRLSPGR